MDNSSIGRTRKDAGPITGNGAGAMIITDDVIARFWIKVDRHGPDDCWEWQGADRGSGYGSMKAGKRAELAHRISWTIAKGAIPEGIYICHHCDNRACVNPSHLFAGTQSDNMLDAYRKGRIKLPYCPEVQFQKGEGHPNSKLTNDNVRSIRRAYASGGVIYRDLAKQYGVDHTLIYQIVNRIRWTHI